MSEVEMTGTENRNSRAFSSSEFAGIGFVHCLRKLNEGMKLKIHSSCRYPVYPGWKQGEQRQDDLHIMYVRGGEGYYYMNDGVRLPLTKGSLVFISNNYRHTAYHNLEKPVEISGFRFGLYGDNGKSMTHTIDKPFYFYTHVDNYMKYDEEALLVHNLFHNNTEELLKETGAAILRQLMVEMYMRIQNKWPQEKKVNAIVLEAKAYIEKHARKKISIGSLADELNVSIRYLQILFKKEVGATPKEYHMDIKMNESYKMLNKQEMLIADIAIECGYADPCTFSHQFKRYFGYSPLEVRKADEKQRKAGI